MTSFELPSRLAFGLNNVPPAADVTDSLLLMVQLLGLTLVPGSAARAFLLLCWALPYILKALLNR